MVYAVFIIDRFSFLLLYSFFFWRAIIGMKKEVMLGTFWVRRMGYPRRCFFGMIGGKKEGGDTAHVSVLC